MKLSLRARSDVNKYSRLCGMWYTSLIWMARTGLTKYVNLLIKIGADVNLSRLDSCYSISVSF